MTIFGDAQSFCFEYSYIDTKNETQVSKLKAQVTLWAGLCAVAILPAG